MQAIKGFTISLLLDLQFAFQMKYQNMYFVVKVLGSIQVKAQKECFIVWLIMEECILHVVFM